MKFVNKENFRDWLMSILDDDGAEMLKEFDTYLGEYLSDVEDAVNNGYNRVEVGSYFTKNHLPEEYCFEVEYDDDDNVTVTF